MAETVIAWKEDSKGRFIELVVGATKDYAIDWSQFFDATPISAAVWTVPVGVTKSGEAVVGQVTQVRLTPTVAGIHECSVSVTANVTEVIPFRVVAR